MKVTNSSEKITPFGGFNFVFNSFKDSGLPDLIDNQLGMRVKTFGFSYSDIFTNHLAIYLNGGDCTEDVNDHLREHLRNVRGIQVCSADTILRGIKELATATEVFENPVTGVKHGFNLNPKLNDLLVKALKLTGQLRENKRYDLDYDNQVQPTEKYDAGMTYKKTYGYQPGIASIDNMPVYLEGDPGFSRQNRRILLFPGDSTQALHRLALSHPTGGGIDRRIRQFARRVGLVLSRLPAPGNVWFRRLHLPFALADGLKTGGRGGARWENENSHSVLARCRRARLRRHRNRHAAHGEGARG